MTGNPFTRTMRLALIVVPVLAVLLALPGTTYAQRMTGELSGVVTDESGGVIPGADVTLTNESSGAVRRSVTNADGFFAFAAVPAATYKVLVAIQGFNSYEVTGVRLGAGDSRTLREIKLRVATVAETVSVTAEVQLTPLNSGEKSTTLTSQVIENIPIVSSSAAELLRILPGMTPITQGVTNRPGFTGEVIGINGNGEYQGGGGNNQSAIGNFSANGTPTKSLDITLDGAPGADPGCNCATSVNPNTEFVQEFKVLQSSFSAEYAKGPNSMTVVTKSGGRDFHGSAFLYFRDYHLNSNEWFANKIEQDRIKNKFVYPGFTFSGPLTLGGFNKNRDKVFFFVGYEYYQQKLDTGYVRSWVPTQAMRNGDFSELPSLGLSGSDVANLPSGYPGGIIPGSAIDPGGRILLNTLPPPNANPAQTGGYNYVDNLLINQPNHQLLARLDFNISDSTKMFVRYNLQRETQDFVIGLWWRQNGQQMLPYPTAVTSPNQSDSVTTSITHVFDPTLTSETILAVTYIDFPNQFRDRDKVSQSALNYPYNGIFTVADQHIPGLHLGSWGSSGPNMWAPGGFDPVLFATKWQYALTQNLTKVWGTHTAKAGFFVERITNNQPGSGWSNGFYVAAPWGGGSTGNTFADLLTGKVAAYEQQTKQVLHNIGWNRFELFAQDSWKARPNLTLNLGLRASIFQPWEDREGNGIVVWDQSSYQSDLAAGKQFPGVSWNAQDSSVPMTGVQTPFYVQPRIGFAWDVRGTGETVLRGGAGMYLWHDAQQPYDGLVDTSAGLRSSSASNTTLADIDNLAASGNLVFNSNSIDINDKKQPKTWNWSLSLNQKLPWSMSLELGYVGNYSDNLMNFNSANYNAVPFGAMLNDPDGNENNYRVLTAYGDLNVYQHSLSSQYHGLQALLARQRGSFNYTLAYTFSKVVGYRGVEGGGPGLSEYLHTPYRNYNYGVLAYDRTHVATSSFSWLLPEPKSEGAVKQILGGWQLAGILSYVDGAPLPYIATGNNFNLTGTGPGGYDLDAATITGSTDSAAQPVLTCNPAEGVPSGYLINPGCFAAPSPGQNGSYNMPYMKAQSYFNADLSLFKNFDLGGDRKLQFRINGYNVLNHPIAYPDPANNLTLSFNNGALSSSNFGKLPEDNKFGRRIVQLAVRFTF